MRVAPPHASWGGASRCGLASPARTPEPLLQKGRGHALAPRASSVCEAEAPAPLLPAAAGATPSPQHSPAPRTPGLNVPLLRGLGVHHSMNGCLLEWGGGLPCVRGRSPSGLSGPGGAADGERAGGCGGAAGGLSALLGTGSGSRRAPSGTPREGCGTRVGQGQVCARTSWGQGRCMCRWHRGMQLHG